MRTLGVLAAIVLVLVGFEVWAQYVTSPPLDVPISVSTGSVDKEIRVPTRDRYHLELVVSRHAIAYERLEELLGTTTSDTAGRMEESGKPIPVRWSLVRGEERVAGADVVTRGLAGMSSVSAFRRIADISVPAGRYHFHAELLQPEPELVPLDPRIVMRLDPKFWTTMQVSVARWGGPAIFVFGIPAVAVVALRAIFRTVVWGRLRRTK